MEVRNGDMFVTGNRQAITVLTMNTLAFTVCFAVWMMNGVLITWLVENGVYSFTKTQIGWLIGIPVLTGSIIRLPVGVMTDKFGGRKVYTGVLLVSAIATYLSSYADSFSQFILGGLGFGLSGTAFAVGIAYTSVWFKKEQQGTALGIFGVGNAGAAFTSMVAPTILTWLTDSGEHLENWRNLPRLYAAALAVTAVIFYMTTHEKVTAHGADKSLAERLAPLKVMRVWRFGLYYFFVFGGYVALSQWMIPYYVNAYQMSIAVAGLLAACFSLPSGVIRALGGWMSDRYGARAVMYWVLGLSLVCSVMLIVPRMDLETPGAGVNAHIGGEVILVSPKVVEVKTKIGAIRFPVRVRPEKPGVKNEAELMVLPTITVWQEPVVAVGDKIVRKQLLARGVSHIFFQANVWIFTILVFVLGIAMGIGKAAVYKHIPDYFPDDVGVVGGIVGVIGGLGGFVCPIVFGYLLEATGLWTTCWMFFAALVVVCLAWMHIVIRAIMARSAPDVLTLIEHGLPEANA